MVEKDIVIKEFMSNNARFADAFNYFLYGGEQVITSDSLTEVNLTETVVGVKTNDALIAQKFRDVLKYTIIKQSSTAYYVMLGIENQTKLDKTMVVHNMIYDTIQYHDQIATMAYDMVYDAIQHHKQIKDEEEYLKPVITLVIYYDSNRWTGPRSLSDMMYPGFEENVDSQFLNYIRNYKLNIIEPCEANRKSLAKLTSDLKPVLSYLNVLSVSYRTGVGINVLLKDDKTFKGVSKDAVYVIDTLTGSNFSSALNDEGTIDISEYLKRVDNIRYNEGIKEGIAKGTYNELLRIVKNFILNGYDLSIIQRVTGISIEQYNQIKDKIENDGDSFKPSDLF